MSELSATLAALYLLVAGGVYIDVAMRRNWYEALGCAAVWPLVCGFILGKLYSEEQTRQERIGSYSVPQPQNTPEGG